MKLAKVCGPLFLTYFYVLLLTVLSHDVVAQLRVGPKAGVQMGRSVFGDSDYREQYSSSFKPGMLVGAVLNYRVNKTYSLQSELFYNQKGRIVERREEFGPYVKNSTLYHYLDLPIMLRLSTHKNLKRYRLEYYLNIGPSFNYWLGGSGKLESGELHEYIDQNFTRYSIRFKDDEIREYRDYMYVTDANRLQMSLDFGGGLIFDLGNGQGIMVDLRTSFGIGKTYMGTVDGGDIGVFGYQDNFEAVNHVVSISVAYLIDIDMMALLQKGRLRR